MAYDKKTINLRTQDGLQIDLTKILLATEPVLSQPSILGRVTSPTGRGFTGGQILKKSKRSQTEYSPVTADKITSGFVGASAQHVGSVNIEKIYRQDNIIGSKIDYAKLKEGKGGDLIALDVADFIITGRELDLKQLLTDAQTGADAMKLYTAKDANGAPTGAQPVQADVTTAEAIKAIKAGKRTVTATDLDANEDNVMNIIRAILTYANELGSDKSPEALYDYAINGVSLDKLVILTNYAGAVSIKDKFTTTFIDLSSAGSRKYNGIVAQIDTVPVIITNQLGVKARFRIMSNRVLAYDLDPMSQYLGVVAQGDGRAIKLANGEVVNVKPSEVTVALEQGRAMGVKYFEEY